MLEKSNKLWLPISSRLLWVKQHILKYYFTVICSRLICQCIFHFWCVSHNRIINTEAVFLCWRMGLNEIWVTYPFLLVLKHLTRTQSHSSKSTSTDWKNPKWLVVVESEKDGVCRSDLKWLLIAKDRCILFFHQLVLSSRKSSVFCHGLYFAAIGAACLFCPLLGRHVCHHAVGSGETWHWGNISSMNSVLRLFYSSNQ